ncbi:MAG: amino acid adenylation domain-containing protein, partial [Proteobacteria bacterium]|nr:amino acid adenylation domain-containing protein [Pseudomonadota bacterium]
KKMYRTGDLARWLPTGNIEFLGRIDTQVSIRGFRVELGEIESQLLRRDDISEAVVIAKEADHGEKRIYAYVTSDKTVDHDELNDYLSVNLPEYMIPTCIMQIEKIPQTTNGKIDLKALPDPLISIGEKHEAPRDAFEDQIASIWAEVLSIEKARIGIDHTFFELGGHSLSAVKAVSKLQDACHISVKIADFFRFASIRKLSEHIQSLKDDSNKADDVQLSKAEYPLIVPNLTDRHVPFPLTDVQQAYWIGRSNIFELGNVAPHIYFEIEMKHSDVKRFNLALQKIVDRHDMLRAVLLPNGEQKILNTVFSYEIEIIDIRKDTDQKREETLKELRETMSHEILDAYEWPLFNLKASRLSDDTSRLHVSFDGIFTDGWSMRICMAELILLYRDPDMQFEPLSISFRDYILSLASISKTSVYKSAEKYWNDRLSSLPPAPELPLAQSTGELKTQRFSRLTGSLERERWQWIKKRASRLGVTPTSLLLAVFSEVLAKWSKNKRFTINLTLFNRLPLHQQVANIVGDFTSLTLLEVDCEKKIDFAERVKQLQHQLVKDLDNCAVSGIHVIRKLSRQKRAATRALMPIVVTSTLGYDNRDDSSYDISQLGKIVYGITQTPQVFLDHQIFEENGELHFAWDFVDKLFPDGLMEDMMETFTGFLNMLSEPDSTWHKPAELSLPDYQMVARKNYNETNAPISSHLLHTLFIDQARKTPDAMAIVTNDRRFTYQEVFDLASKLGTYLRKRGVRPNTFIAVSMRKGWEQTIAVLGILFSGAAYLPIDPSLPKERFSYLLKTSDVEIVLTQSFLLDPLSCPENIMTICVDANEYFHVEPNLPERFQNKDDLAYMIFTSGSTGLPKGVMIDHQGAVNTIIDINKRFNIASADRVFALSNLNFDLSVYDIFGTLAAGGTIVVPDADLERDPAHWADMVVKHQVSVWNSVPALMQLFVERVENDTEKSPKSLRRVLLSGDWIPVSLPDRIRSLVDAVSVISLGGATEVSIWSIFYAIHSVEADAISIPYGKPLTNQKFYVLDSHFADCPVLVPGELYIGGIGLAKGYFKDEEKTRSHFITHPRTKEPLYRTGDWGKFLPDGNIEFLGREDLQVKINGYRIELGEIESVLLQHPGVHEAIVDVVGDRNKSLAAYLVCHHKDNSQAGDENATEHFETDLNTFLSKKIPSYMIPVKYILLEELPLTDNGKVNRKELRALQIETEKEIEYVAPQNEVEQRIAGVWKDVFEIDKIGIHDNFFDLGGNSLLVITLNNKLGAAFAKDIPVAVLYQHMTIHSLAKYMSQNEVEEGSVMEDVTRAHKITKGKNARQTRRTKIRRMNNELHG